MTEITHTHTHTHTHIETESRDVRRKPGTLRAFFGGPAHAKPGQIMNTVVAWPCNGR